MGVSKVNFGGDTLIDLTNDSVTADMLAKGATAHDAAGERVVGMLFTTKVDDSLSATSENPVQNKVITSALESKAGTEVATESTNGLMSKEDKTKLDGVTLDTVLYTPQTLTDTQKKQARDNVDAASNDFIINVTSTDDINYTLDKTFDQINEAVQAGKKVYAKLNSLFIIYLPMVLYSPIGIVFAATAFVSESIEQYVLTVPAINDDDNNPQFIKKLAVTYDSDSTMKQVYMSEDPVNNMQIATKQYVDNRLWYGADMEMSDTSTHPVRNMVIKKYVDDALNGKAGTEVATASTNGLMSAADKAKLDGVEAGANKTIVPTALKNPNALTIKIGSTTVTYDGSTAQTVTIDDGTEVSY